MKKLILIFLIGLFYFSFSCIIDLNTKTFIDSLPETIKDNILWFCDYEDRSFVKWEDDGTGSYNSGGGIFLTDEENVQYGIDRKIKNSGNYSSFATIINANTPGQNKAVRFMRWTDKAWDEGGTYFPDEAYYSVFIYFPYVYNPTKDPENDPNNDGGWWNVFQFKSKNNAGSNPVVVLDLYNSNNKMSFGLVVKDYPDDNSDQYTSQYHIQSNPMELKSKTWIHIEAYYKKSKQYDSQVIVWQDGIEIFNISNIRTVLPPAETAHWGIGNYTDYINGGPLTGSATIYFDDAIVSKVKISDYINKIYTNNIFKLLSLFFFQRYFYDI